MPLCFDPAKEAERRRKISVAKRGRPHFYMRGEDNPAKRPEVRVKISLSMKGKNKGKPGSHKPRPSTRGENNPMKRPEIRAKVSASLKGVKGHPQNEETKRRLHLKLLNHPVSEETKQKISEGNIRAIIDGRKQLELRGRAERITTLKGGTFWCRSSDEVGYARMLDADPEVPEFLHEAIRVPYLYNGKRRNTVPDFFVRRVDSIEIVEIKMPWRLERYERERVKMAAMKAFAGRHGFVFRWWDGKKHA